MNIKGRVHEIGQTQQITDTFKKRDLIVAYAENPQFVEYMKFDTLQDKTSILDGLVIGDEVEIDFNLKGRLYTNAQGVTTYFNSLVAWRVNKIAQGQNNSSNYANMPAPVDISGSDDADDDLPF